MPDNPLIRVEPEPGAPGRYHVSRRSVRGDYVALPGSYSTRAVEAIQGWVAENVVTKYVPWEDAKKMLHYWLNLS